MRPLQLRNPARGLTAACWAVCAGVLLLATGAGAQDDPDPATLLNKQAPQKPPRVGMQVQAGHANAVRSDRPNPIRVLLRNNGPALLGRLVINDQHGHTTETPVELPRGANKAYTLFAQLTPDDNSPDTGTVTLFEGNKGIVKTALRPEYPRNISIVLCATGNGSNLQFLSDRARNWMDYASPPGLPRQWAGYDPANVVVLNGQAWAQMDDEQKRALRMWVERGGHAILCGDSATEWRDPEAQALVGVTPSQVASMSTLRAVAPWGGMPFHASEGNTQVVSGPLTPGSRALFLEGGRPLIVVRETLLGSVLWVGFDPFQESLRSWRGQHSFWLRALETVRKPSTARSGTELSGVKEALQAAQSMPHLPAPPLAVIVVFGLAYAVIFGPVNIAVLRRLRRTVRAWLFVPALALGMTLIVLFVGQSWGNARTVLNSVTVLQAANGGRTALEDTVTGLFSPTNQSFNLSLDDPAPQLTDLGSATGGEDAVTTELGWPDRQTDGAVTWNQVALQLFAVRVLEHQRPRDLGGSFQLDRQSNGATRVSNGTALQVRGAYLSRNGRYAWIGDLKPGASVLVAPGTWQKGLNQALPGTPTALAGQETEVFRNSVGQLWHGARELLLDTNNRRDTWLIAEVEGFQGGLQVSHVPFNNRAALLVVRGLDKR